MKIYIGPDSDEMRDKVRDIVSRLDPSKPWSVEIKPYRKARTNDQIRYYWGVIVTLLADETGATKDEMHEFLMMEYFGFEEYEIFGKRKLRPVRTLSSPDLLPRSEMSNLFDYCIYFAAQQGILIPYPNEEMT